MNIHGKKFLFAGMLLVFLSIPAELLAAQVAIVKSSNHPVFADILSGISIMEGTDFLMYDLNGDKARAKEVLSEIKKSQPAAVVLIGPLAAEKMARELAPIPVIVCGTANTAAFTKGKKSSHIVALPLNPAPEDMLAALFEVVHPASIGIVHGAAFSKFLPKIESWLTAHKVRMETVQINSTMDIDSALSELKEKRIDALFMVPDKFNLSKKVTRAMISFAKKNRIVLFGLTPRIVKMGALFTLSTDFPSIGTQVHKALVQIVKERKSPKDVNVEDARKFVIVYNVSTADAMKMKVRHYKMLLGYSFESGFPVVVVK